MSSISQEDFYDQDNGGDYGGQARHYTEPDPPLANSNAEEHQGSSAYEAMKVKQDHPS